MTPAERSSPTEWSSRFAFLMAAIGSSVGLGNLWRFSAQAGENGGGAFIIIYLSCILLIGIPVLLCEYLLGRAGAGASAVFSVKDVARRSNISGSWAGFAWLGTFSAFFIVSFYCVVAAWVMMYVGKFLGGAFEQQSAEQIAAQFATARADRLGVASCVAVFLATTGLFVARGVNKGIELASKVLMPVFFLLLVVLCVYSLYTGMSRDALMLDGQVGNGAARALEFMFRPDFSRISTDVVVGALGQAFFSIGLGSATMITYGSYISKNANLPASAMVVGLSDSAVALIAGLAIFPIVFAFDLNAAGGAGLFFETLPVALSALPGGALIGAAFFCLATFAALTTSIALFEVVTTLLIERFGLTRHRAVALLATAAFCLSVPSQFSGSFMHLLDVKLTGAILVPLSGLIAVLFVGWKVSAPLLDEQLAGVGRGVKATLLFLVRFVAPVSVAIVLAAQVAQAFF